MQFNSIPFLIAFAVFLILYAFCPERWRRLLMLAGSVAFVAVNSWQAALWALLFTLANFVMGICIQRTAWKKATMGMAVAVNAVALATFKLLNVGMLGLSYYLFSFISYLVEIYRKALQAEHDPIRFASFTFFFPKYTQGPITRYGELAGQLDKPRYSAAGIQRGLESFTLGFVLKILVADRLGVLFGSGYYSLAAIGYESISTKLAWLGAVTTSLHIFIEWEAYMYMALGIASILGYKLPPNFNSPYIARTVGDYYRRWHMTLTRWFKDYIYIPLGGSRQGLGRTVVNVLFVWLLTSIWHGNGLDPKYLIWGIIAGAAVALDPVWYRKMKARFGEDSGWGVGLLGHIWVLLLIPLSIVILLKPGSGFNFILWGMSIGVMIVIERLWKTFVTERFQIGEKLEKKGPVGTVWKVFVSILAHIWVVIPIMLTWVMFTIRDLDELAVYFGRLFPKAGTAAGANPADFSDKLGMIWPWLLVGLFFCFPLADGLLRRMGKSKVGSWILSVILAALFWYAVYILTQNGSDPMGYAAF